MISVELKRGFSGPVICIACFIITMSKYYIITITLPKHHKPQQKGSLPIKNLNPQVLLKFKGSEILNVDSISKMDNQDNRSANK